MCWIGQFSDKFVMNLSFMKCFVTNYSEGQLESLDYHQVKVVCASQYSYM